jgi:membrane protein YdbS with pleckstrin-like domain
LLRYAIFCYFILGYKNGLYLLCEMVANVFLIVTVTVTVIAMIIDTDVFQARCWRYDIDICE